MVQSLPSDEASKYIYVLTPDHGLIGARAQGVRELKSKLRPHLEDFCYSHLSLIRGKQGWRITNAQRLGKNGLGASAHTMLNRVYSLLKVLCAGEEPNQQLFEIVRNAHEYISTSKPSESKLKSLENLTVLRILSVLGYVGEDAGLRPLLDSSEITKEYLQKAQEKNTKLIKTINNSLKETQI